MKIWIGILLAASTLFMTGCDNKPSEAPPLRPGGETPVPTPAPAAIAAFYFDNKDWCETRELKAGGATCQVEYKHAFTPSAVAPGVYTAHVSVLDGCGGQTAAQINAALAGKGDYDLILGSDIKDATMLLISTGQRALVNLQYNVTSFTLQADQQSEVATFTECN